MAPFPDQGALMTLRARVPDHVVHRAFVSETVVLNLETGKYHGLNPTAGAMLRTLETAPTVGDAAARIAAEYEMPEEEVRRDLWEFCADLAGRGLIELDGAPAG